MMTRERELLQQALDALERVRPQVRGAIPVADVKDGIAALREALAAPEPEPVAYIAHNGESRNLCWHNPGGEKTPLYAAPPAAPASQWMPIETAPKDSLYEDGENRYGRRILVWGNGYDEPMRARWWFRIDSNRQNFISDAGFAVFPTHWMPLPAAPDHFRDVAEKVAPAAPVPDGWVMVPKEATREMCVAAVVLNNGNAVYKNVAAEALEIEEQIYGEVWSAMIAASPAAPAAPVVREMQDDLIESVIRDVAELDYSSPEGMPDVMLVTADELRGILQAHGITGDSNAT